MVLILDVGKGVAAVLLVPRLALPGVAADPELPRQWLNLACGMAAIVGHVYPVWFGFRGGKGVATVVGVVGALEPRLLLPLFACWFIVVLLTGYVGLASMLAGAALAVSVYFFDPGNTPMLVFCILITCFVTYTHRGNISRMAAGTENRARRLWLFRPRSV
jgi:glycerol-3-phosphate acyltransferase PlsY